METKICEASRKWLIGMINAIDDEIGLREEDKVLIMMQLNSEEKLDRFNEWIRENIKDSKLDATPVDVMNATAKIGRLKCDR